MYRLKYVKSLYLIPLALNLLLIFFLWLTTFGASLDGGSIYANTSFIFNFAHNALAVLVFIVPVIVTLFFGGEYDHGTFKNPVSYGMDRRVIFLGKLILSAIYSLGVGLLTTVLFIWTTKQFVETAPMFDVSGAYAYTFTSNDFIRQLLKSIPSFLAMLSVSHLLSFWTNKTSSHWSAYFVIIIGIPTLIFYFENLFLPPDGNFRLSSFTPYGVIALANPNSQNLWSLLAIPIIYLVLSLFLGMKIFPRKDL